MDQLGELVNEVQQFVNQLNQGKGMLAGRYLVYYKADPREQRTWRGDLIRVMQEEEVWA